MDYEKKYKEALGWMQSLYNGLHGATKEEAEHYFPELKESEDERMCNVAINACKYMVDNFENSTKQYEDAIAWLEKQSEHANFCNKIQVGDKVTRNRDGMLVNLSQLKRVAKPSEKQGKQKPVCSEEDNKWIESLIQTFEDGYFEVFNQLKSYGVIDWLKSLKQRIEW